MGNEALLWAAIAEAAECRDEDLPPGDHEVRMGVEGQGGGLHGSFGLHGRLEVGSRAVRFSKLLRAALGLLIEAAGRIDLDRLPKQAAEQAVDARTLRKVDTLLRRLRKRSQITWTETPSWKPRA